MDDEHLINIVQKFDFLYDKGKIRFRDVQAKRDAWEAISNEMNSSVDICQRRWNALRERFSREMRQDMLSGSGFEKKLSWPLLQTMLFLKPFVKARRIRSSSNVLSVDEMSEKDLTKEQPKSVVPSSPAPQENILVEYSNVLPEIESGPSEPSTSRCPTKRKAKDLSVEKALEGAAMAVKRVCEAQLSLKNPATDSFGRFVVATLNEMSFAKQDRAISELTSLLMAIKREPA